jgi:hypothetical protein
VRGVPERREGGSGLARGERAARGERGAREVNIGLVQNRGVKLDIVGEGVRVPSGIRVSFQFQISIHPNNCN